MPPVQNGLRFCPIDLHVHTPASKCFRGEVSPEEYVQQALKAGMRAIAVTDHNTGEWIDRIKAAAVGTPLTVFPGVEISVQPGVHILAIFPESRGGRHIEHLLAQLDLAADKYGQQDALVINFGIPYVVTKIREAGALPVLAHIDDYKGAWRELRDKGLTLVQLWNEVDYAAVEIVRDAPPAEIGRDPYHRRPAHYWASDNPHPEDGSKHSHLGIGSRSSLFKLDEPISWEGLRHCFQDPRVRIRPFHADHGARPQHPVIERVRVQGGFLDGLDIILNPNLNCVIGGRGTGKSTLLEVIRYAFDAKAKTEANTRQAQGILSHAFPAGSQVVVDLALADGTDYQVSRTAGEPPRVTRRGDDTPLELRPSDLLPIQSYGQKEIYEISQDPKFQLRLIDNYVAEAIQPIREQENEVIRQLESNAAEILRVEEQIASAEDRLSRLGAVQEEIRRLEEQDFVARLESKRGLDREQHLLKQAEAEKQKVLKSLEALLKEARPAWSFLDTEAIEALTHRAMLENSREQLVTIDADLQQTIQALIERIQARWQELDGERSRWQTDYAEQETTYQELLRESQNGPEGLKPERFVQLNQQLRDLEAVSQQTAERRKTLAQLWKVRGKALEALCALRRQQYQLRCEKADALTKALKRTVRITIHPQGNRQLYRQELERILHGTSVRGATIDQLANCESETPEREAQRPVKLGGETRYIIPRIPRYLDPIDLAAAIRQEISRRDGEESLLESVWGVGSEPMRRNLARLAEEKLFELETYCIPDLPVVELQVASGELGYRELSQLSVGQRCTALLSVVLLESPATLLIDQPEDDLDNQYIFDRIVATLRQEKERRQFIIATHNANIPVSGDAELILVVKADDRHGWIEQDGIGSIDAEPIKVAVERILEGGELAFQIRREKYGLA